MMKYYDIHTHRNASDAIGEDCLMIHSLSQDEIFDGYTTAPNLYFSCGIHPWYIENTKITVSDLHLLAIVDKKVVAIGECGLDKLIDTPMEIQEQIFSEQIELADELGLPVIIHCVKAWDELIELYKKHKPQTPWILHGFRGGRQQAEQLSRYGFYFSVGEHFNKEALTVIYPDRLFLETDESLLLIEDIYDRLAGVLSIEKDVLSMNIGQNVSRVFDL